MIIFGVLTGEDIMEIFLSFFWIIISSNLVVDIRLCLFICSCCKLPFVSAELSSLQTTVGWYIALKLFFPLHVKIKNGMLKSGSYFWCQVGLIFQILNIQCCLYMTESNFDNWVCSCTFAGIDMVVYIHFWWVVS